MSGVTGALVPRTQGEFDVVLLLSPRDGGAFTPGTVLESADRAVGDRRILVAGDIPKEISLMGLLPSSEPHDSLGIRRAGYLFRLDRLLEMLFRLESVAKLVGSLASEGQSSLKTVPDSLPEYEFRDEPCWNPSPALDGEGPLEETEETGEDA